MGMKDEVTTLSWSEINENVIEFGKNCVIFKYFAKYCIKLNVK